MALPHARDNPFEFSRVERVALLFVLLLGVTGLLSGYWMGMFNSTKPLESNSNPEAFQAEIKEWIAESAHLADSISAEKAARRQRYAERAASWKNRTYKPRKYASSYDRPYNRDYNKPWQRNNTSPSSRSNAYRDETQVLSIDTSVPLPDEGSLNPNTVDSSTLLRLGLSLSLTQRWLKYRRSGGSFVRPSDISKLYSMPDTTAARIRKYFAEPAPKAERQFQRKEALVVEINSASLDELMAIRGIGQFFADRIIDYRTRLGGFTSIGQIAETPGLRDSTLFKIEPYLSIDTTIRRKIALNRIGTWQEARHPYLDVRAAKILLAYRQQHGPYTSPQQLVSSRAINSGDLDKLLPYLDFRL